jgi:nudix-type nucleoside diphosphatase (YffH/AdpP family)
MEKAPIIKTIREGYLKIESVEVITRGTPHVLERIKKKDAIAALVYNTDTKKFIFVKQFRPGPMDTLTEIVAGNCTRESEELYFQILDEAQSLNLSEDAISEYVENKLVSTLEDEMKREVMEEIGYKVDKIDKLCSFYSSPGVTTETMFLFVCYVSEKTEAGGGLVEEHEEIEIVEYTMEELSSAEFTDAKTIIALMHIPNLFK